MTDDTRPNDREDWDDLIRACERLQAELRQATLVLAAVVRVNGGKVFVPHRDLEEVEGTITRTDSLDGVEFAITDD